MAEPLKNLYNAELVDGLCGRLVDQWAPFDAEGFRQRVFEDPWESLELKERMARISESLAEYLPDDYEEALEILKPVSEHFSGFEYMFFPGFVELKGLDKFEPSVAALEHVTPFSSSEFAVRPFIVRYGASMMERMEAWADSPNEHVRRLASEGCRPRLPWAMALPEFKKDPTPVLPILEKLRHDPSEYVRRSVANNVNDIAKDHPDLVVDLARRWLGETEEGLDLYRLVKHGCRTLLKAGHPEAMGFFGFADPAHLTVQNLTVSESVVFGEALEFSFDLLSQDGALGKVRLEYGIDFVKKNGSRSRKVFKISEVDMDESSKTVHRRHVLKKISTRVYYPGVQGLGILINGKELAAGSFELTGL